jgi:MFS family permease
MTPLPTPRGLSGEFVKFWLGQSASMVGNQFTILALPIAGAVTLHASAFEMGVLGALRFAPALFVGLPAGVWADRTKRKPLLIGSQLASAVALATIPAAALLHALTLGQLYLVAFTAGAAATLQNIVLPAFVPTIAGRDHLVEANTRIQGSLTVANLVGPGLAGATVQLLTAPIAIAFDAVAFVAGALTAAWARVDEPAAAGSERSIVHEVAEGLTWLWKQPLLRAISLTLVINLGGSNVVFAVLVLYFVATVGVTPVQLGLVFVVSGVTSLAGALLSRPLVRRGWLGRVMAAGAVLVVGGQFGVVFAAFAPRDLALPILVVSNAVVGCALMVYNVNQQSIRQSVTPDRLLGRVQSSLFVLAATAQVAGSLTGGAIGQSFGLRAAIVIGSVICLVSALPSVFSPLRSLGKVPTLGEVRSLP